MEDGQRLKGRRKSLRHNHGGVATLFTGGPAPARAGNGPGTPVLRREPFAASTRRCPQKKRVSIFDERSRYVIENKGSAKRTKPNEANYSGCFRSGHN